MEIAVIENDQNQRVNTYKHNLIHLTYIITSTICFIVAVYRHISIDLFYGPYTNNSIPIPSLNRYPTEFTASYTSISYLWYILFIWQSLWIIYSLIGIFRRTPSGFYFYQYPCAMNDWAFFYTALALLLYIPYLTINTDNAYSNIDSVYRHFGTFVIVVYIIIIVNTTLQKNMRDYFRDKYFLDVWLTRLLYQNGLALWASILFYETCLSLIVSLIYSDLCSPSSACFIGNLVFLIGIIIAFIYESYIFDDSVAFVLTHWFAFFWLMKDMFFAIFRQLSPSVCSTRIVPVNFYFVIFCIICRLRLFYLFCKEKNLPSFHSGRVYSLIQPPRAF